MSYSSHTQHVSCSPLWNSLLLFGYMALFILYTAALFLSSKTHSSYHLCLCKCCLFSISEMPVILIHLTNSYFKKSAQMGPLLKLSMHDLPIQADLGSLLPLWFKS